MTASSQVLRSGIGAALRAERERRHVSLDAVARGTLVRQDFLELIDQDRLEELPSGAYARGFIRSYVAYLGLDPKPFLDSYEQRCGRPEPELSRVVRRGVRVPPAAQKRAWKIAIGSAAAAILLLAFLGAFRSGDAPDELPSVASAAARVESSSLPNAMGTVVRVEAISDESWIEVSVDGQPVFAQTLKRGQFETFRGTDSIVVFLARAKAIRITANGEILSRPEGATYRGVFTPKTTTLPPNEPQVAPPLNQDEPALAPAAKTDETP